MFEVCFSANMIICQDTQCLCVFAWYHCASKLWKHVQICTVCISSLATRSQMFTTNAESSDMLVWNQHTNSKLPSKSDLEFETCFRLRKVCTRNKTKHVPYHSLALNLFGSVRVCVPWSSCHMDCRIIGLSMISYWGFLGYVKYRWTHNFGHFLVSSYSKIYYDTMIIKKKYLYILYHYIILYHNIYIYIYPLWGPIPISSHLKIWTLRPFRQPSYIGWLIPCTLPAPHHTPRQRHA